MHRIEPIRSYAQWQTQEEEYRQRKEEALRKFYQVNPDYKPVFLLGRRLLLVAGALLIVAAAVAIGIFWPVVWRVAP